MDSARSPLRSVLDYLGFIVYATIVGGSLPDREVAEAAHPRNQLAIAERPRLTIVPPSETIPEITPAPVVFPDRYSNAA